MANGPGYLDPNGIWQYGEDDTDVLMSDLLNLGQLATSGAVAAILSRLARGLPYAIASGRGTRLFAGAASGAFQIDYPAGRFTVAPIVRVDCDDPSLGAYFVAQSGSNIFATVQGFNGAAGLTVPYQWTAIQMTSGAAEG